jgi:hypothetical protein
MIAAVTSEARGAAGVNSLAAWSPTLDSARPIALSVSVVGTPSRVVPGKTTRPIVTSSPAAPAATEIMRWRRSRTAASVAAAAPTASIFHIGPAP